MKSANLVIILFWMSVLICCPRLSQAQENDKFPVASELVENILSEVGRDNVSGATSNVADILKDRFGISTPETWSYWIRVREQNSHLTLVNKQRVFDSAADTLVVYKAVTNTDAMFKDADLIVTDGREEIRVSSDSLGQAGGFWGREEWGTTHLYTAWSIQDGIILACGNWRRGMNVRVWHIDSSGTTQWTSELDVGFPEAIGDFIIHFVDGVDAVAFYLSGDKEQAVFVFDKQSGENVFWWSTRLYPSAMNNQ